VTFNLTQELEATVKGLLHQESMNYCQKSSSNNPALP
jgi:hypothetical protein